MKALLKRLLSLLRLLPLFAMAGIVLWLLLSGRELTVESLLASVPEDRLMALLFLWFAFALKSLSVMVPVMLLFAVSGALFPLAAALAVNIVGVGITMTLPYFIGRFSGPDLTQRLMDRYPRLSEMRSLRSENGLFFAFFVRAVGILPCDIVSLYMGNTRLPYAPYLLGGVLGFLPDLVCTTLLGTQISHSSSPWFWLTIALNLGFCLLSVGLYRRYRRQKNS